jgi:hypothetical protein
MPSYIAIKVLDNFLSRVKKRENCDQKKSLLSTKMEIFTASANPTFARYDRLVTVLAQLLQTKHNEIFIHVAHPFAKLATLKNKTIVFARNAGRQDKKNKIKRSNLVHKKNILRVSFSVVAFGNTQEPSYLCLFFLFSVIVFLKEPLCFSRPEIVFAIWQACC